MRYRRAVLSIVLLGISTAMVAAHKGATSRFTYNAHVHQIFVKRCSGCHVDGGVGPMSLVVYQDAFPWAESIRIELLAAEAGDPHDFVKAAHRGIPARELDVVLEWASGGTPEGDASSRPTPPGLRRGWTAGDPDMLVPMPALYMLGVDEQEGEHDAAAPLVLDRVRQLTAIDVLPGNPAILRSVVLSLRDRDGSTRLLGTWTPKQDRAPLALRPAVPIVPGSSVVARLRYKKTWKLEGDAASDRSTIGLYFAD